MDFHLTKEQLLVRKMYRDFAENEVKPLAAEIDEEERFPMETVEKMAKLGMMGIYFPKEYGGAGADVLSYAMCVEELAKVCGTTAVIVSAHTSLCAAPIFENGTEEQKMKYLPDLCSGKKIGAFGLTEPGAGTDAQGQQTTAVLDESGENYILNGSKCFITNGNVADTFVVIAVTGKTVDKRGRSMKEISAFIVEKDDKGFSQGKHEKKMGIRGSSTCDLIFEDCVIPKDRMLGKKGEGFKIAMKTLDGGRIGIASQALGLGEGAVEEAIKYTKERVQFGKRISQFQNTQFQLADMHTRTQAAQYLIGDGQLLGSLVVTGVGHLYDNVRIGGFFQRALERFHQVVGQAADEADRIHQNNLQAAGQGQLAGGGVQRGEQHVRLKDLLAAQGVQQAGLAHVGVAHQCHHGHIVFLSGAAGLTPALLHLF